MSAAIMWQAIKGKRLEIGVASAFAQALRLPREFTERDSEWLRGVAAGRQEWREPIDELVEAIATHGAVRVWAEY